MGGGGQVVTRRLMVEFTRRIMLLTIASVTPAVASAQVPFSAASGPGARGEPSVLTDTAGEIRAGCRGRQIRRERRRRVLWPVLPPLPLFE